MALTEDIRMLSQVPLFRAFDEQQLRLIAFGAEHRKIAAGQILFREGSPAECAFVVTTGRFELVTATRDGRSELVATPGQGTLLSELALFTLAERKYTALAVEDSEVIRLTRALFHRLVEEYPEIGALAIDRITSNLQSLAKETMSLHHRFM